MMPDVTPEAAHAEMTTLRDSDAMRRGDPATRERYHDLALIAYGAPAPAAPPPAIPTHPAAQDARLDALRDAMGQYDHGSEAWRAARDEHARLLLARHTPPPAEAAPATSASETATGVKVEGDTIEVTVTAEDAQQAKAVAEAYALPEGTTWNQDLLQSMRALTRNYFADAAEADRVWAGSAHALWRAQAEGPPPSPEDCAATLQGRWGGGYDVMLERARAVARELPDAVRDFLDDTGLGNHPDVVEYFSAIGERMEVES